MAIPMFRNALLAGTGLALLAATPAGAQTQDCQQRLDRIEASLEEVELSQAQLGEFRDIIGGARTLAEQGSTERCLRVVEELNTVLADLGVQVQEGEGAVTAEAAIGGQGETEVLVEQPRPRVVVQQQPPVVNVQVPEPQVSVRVPEPQVTVRIPEPVISVEMPEPVVTVQMPEPQVDIQQPEPEVSVQMPEPQVSVQQPQPEVAVEMPRPDIEIDQPQPEVEVAEAAQAEVEVQQAEAQVQVEQAEGAAVEVEQGEAQLQVEQAEPQIQVEQAEPRVNVVRAGEQDQLQEEQQEAAAVAQEELAAVEEEPEVAAQNPLAALSANQVLGADVVTTEGQEIAEIEDIVRARTGGEQLYAILSVGGFLGLGDKDVAIDFDRLEVGSDGQIVMPAATESQLEEMPAYTQDDYESVIR